MVENLNNQILKISSSGTFTTFAGSGGEGYADGVGTSAIFNRPNGITVDSSGNLYVADAYNNRIRKITPTVVVTTFAGSGNRLFQDGIGTAASFNNPEGITIDKNGNLYVSDSQNHGIRKITRDGIVTTLAGSGNRAFANGIGRAASFNYPMGLAFDDSNNVFVADKGNNRIRKINSAGVVTTFAGSGSGRYADGIGSSASFYLPYGITIDISRNLYVADYQNNRIRKVTAEGVVTTVAGSNFNGNAEGAGLESSFNLPTGVALGSSGNIYFVDSDNQSIRKISNSGVVSTFAGGHFADGIGYNARFYGVARIVVDASRNLYVADCSNNRIRKITTERVVTTLAGSGHKAYADGVGTTAFFYFPVDIALDASGNIYVADVGNNRIRKVTPSGVVTTLAGSVNAGFSDGIGTAASFDGTNGIAVDNVGNVYVADALNHRIRKVTPAGVVTTLAGSGNAGYADGAGLMASFNLPTGVAVDSSGNVYVADQNNHLVRKITPSGIVTTFAGSGIRTQYGDGAYGDGIGTAASFNRPTGVAIDAFGNLFVADSYNFKIRKITPSGVVTTLAIMRYNFSWPSGPNRITVDANGDIYFGDNSVINKITPCRSYSTPTRSICAGSSYFFGGIARTAAGTYTDTLVNVLGCDSIITLRLAVNTASSSNISKSICTGSSYFFGGMARTISGTYYETLTNRIGCDSVITLTLRVNPHTTSSISRSICAGSSYVFGGIARTRAGIYKDTVISVIGCDSVITLTLSINSPTSSTITSSLCQGKRLYFGSQILTSAGTYTNTIPNKAGCDSVITLNLALNPVSTSASLASICEGSLFTFAGVNLNTTGVYVDSSKNKYGCDSVAFLDLRINPIPATPTITQRKDTLFATTNGDRFQWYKGDTLLKGDTLYYLKTNYLAGNYRVIANKNSCNSPFSPVIKISTTNKVVSTLRIYPNPVSSQFTIEVTSPTTVQVLNLLGQVVISQTVSGKNDVNTSMLSNGTYVVLAEGFDATRLVVSK